MGVRKLTRMQKASALLPMAVLTGAWGAALSNSTLASASGGISDSEIPDVPATAFEQPASVQPAPEGIAAGIDDRAGTTGAVQTLSTNGIPSAALYAYRRAETLLGKADPTCKLPWNLVAAIGRVESNHGRINGNSLNADGAATPGIYGVALDGQNGRAKITDTEAGALDKDPVYDRAVGPMQFIPGTWSSVGVDSDNDGKKNVQDIDDSATSAGIYLCAGSGDLSDPAQAAVAVKRYNRSDSYVDTVLKISAAYAQGDFSQSPDGLSASPVLTSTAVDQTLTPTQRTAAKKAEEKAEEEASEPTTGASGGTAGAGGTTGTGGGGTAGGGSTGGGSTGGSTPTPSTPSATPTNPVGDLVEGTVKGLNDTVKGVGDTVNGLTCALTNSCK